jgi:menaquinone-9 beta-reductase
MSGGEAGFRVCRSSRRRWRMAKPHDHGLMPENRRYDVAIIGAGPAGAMTALLTARSRPDLKILLVDALAEPRHKPCGEFLGPHGVRVLGLAGIEQAVLKDGAQPLTGLSLHAGRAVVGSDFAPVFGRVPPKGHGLGVRRERFDRRLQEEAAAAGAELQRGVAVEDLVRDGDGWRVHCGDAIISATLVVGADGRSSMVRRRAGLDRPTARKRFALVCRARGIEAGTALGFRHGEMHVGPFGQVGLAPLGAGEVNLNLLLSEDSRRLLRHRTPEQMLRAALTGTPSLAHRCREALLGTVLATGSLPRTCRAVNGEGVALVGDAAGFWDPFTGDGMTLALRGAELLAGCIADGSPAAPARYAHAWRGIVAGKRWSGGVLHHVLQRRRLAETLVALLGRSPAMGRMMAGISGGYVFA